ncbi:MAG TPA: hypothetical protein VMI31_18555 [Fimbriimonadaceae bacterium]|nr:hypothetical protein [Fimbriimonadaceae bacterium]
MTTNRILIAAAAVGLGNSAFAQYTSPELMLITDAGGTTLAGTTVSPQVERYDPYTGAYLGAFGAGYFDGGIPDGIVVAGPNAYVTELFDVNNTEFSRIEEFNYSTGAYQGTIFNSGPFQLTSVNPYGGNLIATDFGNSVGGPTGIIWTLSPTGAEIGAVSLPTNVVTKGATVVNNQLWVSTLNNASGNQLYVYNLNANGTTSGGPTIYGASGNAYTSVATTSVSGTQYVYAGGYNTAGTNGVIDRFTTSGGFAGESVVTSDPYAAYSLAAGHNGILYSWDFSTDKILRWDGGASFGFGSLGSFTLDYTAEGQNIAVYAAPEPVSMTALGAGVLGLMLRRRRRAVR